MLEILTWPVPERWKKRPKREVVTVELMPSRKSRIPQKRDRRTSSEGEMLTELAASWVSIWCGGVAAIMNRTGSVHLNGIPKCDEVSVARTSGTRGRREWSMGEQQVEERGTKEPKTRGEGRGRKGGWPRQPRPRDESRLGLGDTNGERGRGVGTLSRRGCVGAQVSWLGSH